MDGDFIESNGGMSGGFDGMVNKSYALRLKELEFGNMQFKDIPVTSNGMDLVLFGNKVLEKFLITLDYPSNKMVLKHLNSLYDKNIPSFGLNLTNKDGKKVVSGIWQNSSAALSGLQIGDEIITIDSTNIKTMCLFELIPQFIGKDKQVMEIEYVHNKKRQNTLLHKEILLPAIVK